MDTCLSLPALVHTDDILQSGRMTRKYSEENVKLVSSIRVQRMRELQSSYVVVFPPPPFASDFIFLQRVLRLKRTLTVE